MINEKRFVYGETDLFEWVEDNGKIISTKECVKKLNEQQAIIEQQEQSITISTQEIADTQAILEMLSEKLKGWNNE